MEPVVNSVVDCPSGEVRNDIHDVRRAMCEDVLKFTAYRGIAEDYEAAAKIACERRLILGEPAVVPFSHDGAVELLFAIGSAVPCRPYLSSSAFMSNVDFAVITDSSTGDVVTLKEYIGEHGGGDPGWGEFTDVLK